MNFHRFIIGLLLLGGVPAVFAQPTNKLKFAEIVPMLETGRLKAQARARLSAGTNTLERPVVVQTPEGYIESLSSGPDLEFPTDAQSGEKPEESARIFLKKNAKLFGVENKAVDFKLRKKNSNAGRHSIRLTQHYDGIPVFGGEMVVQVNDAGGVEHVSGKIDRNTDDLDQKRLSTKPKFTATEAETVTRAHYATQAAGQVLSVTPPELTLLVPSLMQIAGPKRLAWKMDVWSADKLAIGSRVFIDAHSGEVALELALIHQVLNRSIYDHFNNSNNVNGTLVRSEGGAPASLAEANYAYDYLGDTYNFYFSRFGRDGIYGTNGTMMVAHVRFCRTDGKDGCPMANASGGGSEMYFGDGYAVGDDVCGHEMTHGVINAESGLIYTNESGAINESLADVFGEFVDLTNGKGNDSAEVRWKTGEELSGGAFRSMKNPTDFGQPDWLGSTNYQQPSDTFDRGGVHVNSGVNNKLCYLLTDGDTFRDIAVTGMGINPVAALYYEANVNLLTSSSGWNELAIALRQAAINLGWSDSQRVNLQHAMVAVGIGTPSDLRFVDEDASGACYHTGDSHCAFLFDNGPYNNLNTAITNLSIPKTLLLRGTAKQTRLSGGQARIVPWDGSARIQAP